MQAQLVQQKLGAGQHQCQFGAAGVVAGLQQIKRGAVPHLAAQLGGVQAGQAGLTRGSERMDAAAGGLDVKPGAAGLLAHLLAAAFKFAAGLVFEAQRFVLARAAVTPGVQRHAQLQADHSLVGRVAGATKLAIATQAIPSSLGHQIERGGGRSAVPGCFLLRQRHLGRLQAQLEVVRHRLAQPMAQWRQVRRHHIVRRCKHL